MKAVKKIIENYSNPLTIDLPKEYENHKLEIIILSIDEQSTEIGIPKYNFSDLVGKLQWKGDALMEQKKLRDEWE